MRGPLAVGPSVFLGACAATAMAASWWLLAQPGVVHGVLHAQRHPAGPETWILAVVMWQLMMIGMMMPVMWPWLRAVAVTHAREDRGPALTILTFACGYFTAWLLYATAAASLQVGLQSAHLLETSLVVPPPWPGFVLVLAGLFQFSRLKHACLAHCRSPFTYLLMEWHDGPPSVYGMGLKHGLYCVACCWALMLLGFALGLMNLTWMAVITVIAAIEQIAPSGARFARGAGAALIGWGLYLLVQ